MKKNTASKEGVVEKFPNKGQSVIGLYEMLAQAQQSLSNEHSAFLDRMTLNSNSFTKSDE